MVSTGEEYDQMQTAFCTNCGKPLDSGATFCANCGTRVEAPPAAPASTAYSAPPATPAYTPGSTPQPSFTPSMPPQNMQPQNQNQSRAWVGWLVGCLGAFLLVVLALIGLLVFGLVTHKLVFFAIGLGGIALLIFIGVIIEHQIRRFIHRRRFNNGLMGGGFGGDSPYRDRSSSYRQPRFSLIRFIFSLAIIAGALYGGLYLYYSQQFVGEWSGVLKIGTTQQGITANVQISLTPHAPASNASYKDWPSLSVTQLEFKPTTATACKGTPASYGLSGTATRLDASDVGMTLKTTTESIQLHGTYTNGLFTLSGTNAKGQPVTLSLERGAEQDGYRAACGG
jgi:hypothetical protein